MREWAYRDCQFSCTGVYNPDGSLVEGINYTPLYNYGWFPSAITPEKYRPKIVRQELKLLRKLGFNSIRLLESFWLGMFERPDFTKVLDEYMDNYDDLLSACRETCLTALIIMVPAKGYQTPYQEKNSCIEQILRAFVTRFDEKYADVLVGWEIANEPDLNTWGLPYAQEIEIFSTDKIWNSQVKPYLQWCTELVRNLGAKKPLSIGAMNSPRCDRWDAETFDVLNIHNYRTTIRDIRNFNRQALELDQKVLGHTRPVMLTEVAHPGGMRQQASDIMQYCRDNEIAYYIWGSASVCWEADIQGLLDTEERLRGSGLPFDMFRIHPKQAPLGVPGYDLTAGGNQLFHHFYQKTLDGLLNDGDLYTGTEELYDFTRSLVPYWTPDFWDVFRAAPGQGAKEKLRHICQMAARAQFPYIRLYGDYTNDNVLGGTLPASYYESSVKHNTEGGFNLWRSRFAFGRGRGGSTALMMQSRNLLLLQQPLDPAVPYVWRVELAPAPNSWAGLGIACWDDRSPGGNPGVYIRFFGEKTLEDLPQAEDIPSYLGQVFQILPGGEKEEIGNFSLPSEIFDSEGYVQVEAAFQGNGTPLYPLTLQISADGRLLWHRAWENGPGEQGRYVALIAPEAAPSLFNSLRLSRKEDNQVLLSDTFSAGKEDGDLLTYAPNGRERREGDSEKGKSNREMREILLEIYRLAGGEAEYCDVPKDLRIGCWEDCAVLSWNYFGAGESGFEIQCREGNGSWVRCWRTLPNSRMAVIPLHGAPVSEYWYRVASLRQDGGLNAFSSPRRATKKPCQPVRIGTYWLSPGETV